MTRSISSKLTAILAVSTLCLFACTTTSETEPAQESMDTGSEFRTGDQGDVEAVTIGDSRFSRTAANFAKRSASGRISSSRSLSGGMRTEIPFSR